MPESQIHIRLVARIVSHVTAQFPDCCLCVLRDHPESNKCEKPPGIGGYHPDVFAEDTPPTFTIIGEAKTAEDLETDHSKLQFRAFLSYLQLRPKPRLIVATQWYAVNSARSLLAAAKREVLASDVLLEFVHY